MKVAFISRSTLFTGPGGDTVQMNKTAEYLGKLGVKVDIFAGSKKINPAQYDLLHGFNIIRPADLLPAFRAFKKPKVLSTIYVDYTDYDHLARTGFNGAVLRSLGRNRAEYLKTVMRWIMNGEKNFSLSYVVNGHRNSVKELIKRSNLLLPNSHSEYRRLARDYKIEKNYCAITNAIDASVFNGKGCEAKKENLVICVARIDGPKNQLNLIRALNNKPCELLIIGKPAPNHIKYYEACKREAADNVKLIAQLKQEELREYYCGAKVHAMPSWFETTGLSSLEAAAMGCNIVIGNRGDASEYFGDLAYYCEPASPESIWESVQKALKDPKPDALQKAVFDKHTWQETAKQTLNAYESVIRI